ncbi:MAG: SDR family NAD(P)-dependent oxidoreductase, partial [Verrucomicrobia bacterium]|nr:SDR family NAD(P)-dependent oxidoreductase [Verrucomicrobiota bacterium]
AIAGLAHSTSRANSYISWKVVQLSGSTTLSNATLRRLLTELHTEKKEGDAEVRYLGDKRYIRRLEPVSSPGSPARALVSLRPGGVYWITGGASGLGLLLAKYLVSRYGARLVLSGRSSSGRDKCEEVQKAGSSGAEVSYIEADVRSSIDVARTLQTIVGRFGCLNGIFHCAGVSASKPLLEADRRSFEEVLGPKVQGLLNIDVAAKDIGLDVLVLFSSISSELGDFQTGSYAAANRFMDSFAAWRNALVKVGKRRGKTLSINWPLWREGGFGTALAPEDEALYTHYCGMTALPTDVGLDLLLTLLGVGDDQIVVAAGGLAKIERALKLRTAAESVDPDHENGDTRHGPAGAMDPVLQKRLEHYLRQTLANVTKLSVNKVDPLRAFEDYGLDSIMVLDVSRQLAKDFPALPATLFFEVRNLRGVVAYLLREQAAQVLELFAKPKPETESAEGGGLEKLVDGNVSVASGVFAVGNDGQQTGPVSKVTSSDTGRAISSEDEGIAIIGVAGRYPMAENIAAFWDNLKAGRDCIVEVPKSRWDYRRYFDPNHRNGRNTYSKWGGFIDGVDWFDPHFFRISPKQAKATDPQERLFLQTAWETLEDAGYTPASLNLETGALGGKSVGVFVGVMWNDYQLFAAESAVLGGQVVANATNSSIANHVSFFFDFHGPSLVVDTACSSSLLAVYLACESLRRGECSYALAGGVNLSIHPSKYIKLSQMGMLSSDGRCRSFGEGGDGYVPGEGVGALLLKPVRDARRDGDAVYAVIRGGAVNHGGRTHGFTVPNLAAQAALIRQAHQRTGILARSVSYIEAHGTGTALGDPIEFKALCDAFGESRDKGFCAIGSLKSNIGHLEGAAGIAGLTKVLMQLKHRQLCPSLHAEVVNPLIDFGASPFVLQRELRDWEPATVFEAGAVK